MGENDIQQICFKCMEETTFIKTFTEQYRCKICYDHRMLTEEELEKYKKEEVA